MVKTQTIRSPSNNRRLPTIVTAGFYECNQSGSVNPTLVLILGRHSCCTV